MSLKADNLGAWLVAAVVAALVLTGCGQAHHGTGAAPGGEASGSARRIVSLAPALTQVVRDLGMGDQLVGVAQHDAPAADLGLPVVGSFVDIDTERLLRTNPTDVLLCYGKSGPSPRLKHMAQSGLFTLTTFPYPRTIQDVADMIYPGPRATGSPGPSGSGSRPPSLGQALGAAGEAGDLRTRMLDRLDRLRTLTTGGGQGKGKGKGAGRPRVLLVFGTSPVMASGPGTVNDQLLGYVGAVNAAGDAAVSAPTYDHEGLVALRPDVVVLLMPGAPPLGKHDPRVAGLESLPIPAAEHHRITLINDPLALLPSSSLPRIAAEMARAIHPELAAKIDAIVPKGEDAHE